VSEYYPLPGQNETELIARIPLPPVTQTFPYLEDTYGAANPYMGTGEATCKAVYVAAAAGAAGGKAVFSIDELSRVAMERSTTAREAVALMGDLAVKHGFYGPATSEGSGESLIVADPAEGWVFHVLPDATGASAIWAAQRVPSGHVTVIANTFIIRTINASDPNTFQFGPNIAAAAAERGCPTPVDFSGCFSGGEYPHKYSSGRRMWRAYSLLAPQLQLAPEYGNIVTDAPFPFSAPPARPVALADVFAVYRDYLEGTAFDMTVGPASGPFGTPDRYTAGNGEHSFPKSWWERPIGLFRTSNTYVTEVRPHAPAELRTVLWYGPHAAHGTVFQPFFPALPSSVAGSYAWGHQHQLNRTTAFWAHRFVLNIAQIKFDYMMPRVRQQQIDRERAMQDGVALWTQRFASGALTPAHLARLVREAADDTVAQWWALADDLMFRFADGFVSTEERFGQSVGYPSWWLKHVGYDKYHPDSDRVATRAVMDAGAEPGMKKLYGTPVLRRVSGEEVETPSESRSAARRAAVAKQAALYAAAQQSASAGAPTDSAALGVTRVHRQFYRRGV
jgi:dipeptidase